MSNSPASTPQGHSSTDADSPTGFNKAFRKIGEKVSQSEKLKFVHQNPGEKRKQNRISRLLKLSSSPSSQGDEDESQTAAQRRRQQVYQAQKRHRNKNAEYVQNLEAEVARLQHLDAVINSERNALAHQNTAIRDFLATQGIDAPLDSNNVLEEEISHLGGASLDIRMDTDLGHPRTFLDFEDLPDSFWTSTEPSSDEMQPNESQPSRLVRHAPVAGDSCAALDFILALEWPCQSHIKHHAINPNIEIPEACVVGKYHGHALTATQAVYQSALPAPDKMVGDANLLSVNIENAAKNSVSDNWILPHSEIDKLVDLAEMLELDDEYMTPAQAYSAVRQTVPNDSYLKPTLEALKKPLGTLVWCHGFGAVLESPLLWQHVDETIQTLRLTRLDLDR